MYRLCRGEIESADSGKFPPEKTAWMFEVELQSQFPLATDS